MTDKEIIIDGVDVSRCEYCSSTPNSTLCYMKGNKCEDNPNCFYKQLQRLTVQYDKVLEHNKNLQREVENLTELVEEAKEAPICFQCKEEPCIRKEKEKLELECEGLKEKNKEYIAQCFDKAYKLKKFKEASLNYETAKKLEHVEHECDRYRKALEKIENFMIYEFSGQNEWVKTSVLNIINKAKEVKNETI